MSFNLCAQKSAINQIDALKWSLGKNLSLHRVWDLCEFYLPCGKKYQIIIYLLFYSTYPDKTSIFSSHFLFCFFLSTNNNDGSFDRYSIVCFFISLVDEKKNHEFFFSLARGPESRLKAQEN